MTGRPSGTSDPPVDVLRPLADRLVGEFDHEHGAPMLARSDSTPRNVNSIPVSMN